MRVPHQIVERLFKQNKGIMRMSNIMAAGVNRRTLYSMVEAGHLERISRGLYRLSSLSSLETPDLVTVAKRIPKCVICLVSALAYHRLTTQIPHAVDVAIVKGAERPRIDYPPVNVYWFSGSAFTEGVQKVEIDGHHVRMYSAEKSIADAFKYRNKIGLDIAIEALKLWRERPGITFEQLLAQARICRVERVIRPYLETVA
jgi:predicted transcriptional regulator of viral defense system